MLFFLLLMLFVLKFKSLVLLLPKQVNCMIPNSVDKCLKVDFCSFLSETLLLLMQFMLLLV